MAVSVIIPTYNRGELLREALSSVFAQTCTGLQVIVVDDGSTDHTTEVLDTFRGRITAIRLGRSGISAARNAGIEAATEDFIAFLDSDDRWLPDKIEKHLSFARSHPEMPVTYTDAVQFSSAGPEQKSFVENFPALNYPNALFRPMIEQFAIPLTSTVMIKTSFLKQHSLRFPVHVALGEDLYLFLQILQTGGEFGYLPERLTLRRMHDSNVSSNHRRRFEQRKLLYADLLRCRGVSSKAEQNSALKAGLRDATYRVAECDWEDCNFKEARQGFFNALAMDPRGMRAFAYGMMTLLPSASIDRLRDLRRSA